MNKNEAFKFDLTLTIFF